MKFSKTEKLELLKAWLALTLAFTLIFTRSFDLTFLLYFFIIFITAGVGFLLHEIAHKLVATRYGHRAEFIANDKMLLLAIVVAFFLRIVIAAPGAVYIHGHVTRKQNGIISAAGPWTNILLALLFLPFLLWGTGFIQTIGWFGTSINAWLALFNMIPIWNLDGAKVLKWNLGMFALTIIVAGLLTFFSFYHAIF